MSDAAVGRSSGHRRTTALPGADDPLVRFLSARLTEELARLWDRDERRPRRRARGPGLASQLAVVDEQLLGLRAGRLPDRLDLRMLLYGYGSHPDYDPTWTDRLLA